MTPEEIEQAEIELNFLEELVDGLEEAVLAPLKAVVHVDSDLQAFIYVADDNNLIQTKQNAHFVAEGIILIGDELTGTENGFVFSPNGIGVSIGPMDGATITNGTTAPGTNNLPNDFTVAQSQSQLLIPTPTVTIPIDVFVPTTRQGDDNPRRSVNTDYWHSLAAEWFIPKGRVIQLTFRYDAPPAPATGSAVRYSGTAFTPDSALVGYLVNQ